MREGRGAGSECEWPSVEPSRTQRPAGDVASPGVHPPVLSRVRDRVGARKAPPPAPRGGHGEPRLARRLAVQPTRGELGCASPLCPPARGSRASHQRRPRGLPGRGAGEPGRRVRPSDPGKPSASRRCLSGWGNPDKGGAPLADPRTSATRAINRQLSADCEEVPRLPLPAPVRGKSLCDCREAESAVPWRAGGRAARAPGFQLAAHTVWFLPRRLPSSQ